MGVFNTVGLSGLIVHFGNTALSYPATHLSDTHLSGTHLSGMDDGLPSSHSTSNNNPTNKKPPHT